QAGQELHYKAGLKLVIEAATAIHLKAGAGSILIDAAGVHLNGPTIGLNGGGGGGVAAASEPGLPRGAEIAGEARMVASLKDGLKALSKNESLVFRAFQNFRPTAQLKAFEQAATLIVECPLCAAGDADHEHGYIFGGVDSGEAFHKSNVKDLYVV